MRTATSNVTITVKAVGSPARGHRLRQGRLHHVYRVYRGTSTGTEALLTGGGCSGLGAVLSCTDTGLTNGQAHFYKIAAVNAIGEGAQSDEASATPVASSCTPTQLLGNPGFETRTAAPWPATSGVISNSSEPKHSGSGPRGLTATAPPTLTPSPRG